MLNLASPNTPDAFEPFPGFAPLPPVSSPPATSAPADREAEARVAESLDRLEELSDLLATEAPYDVPPLGYALPAGFKLSVVIPVYNEERTIREIVARVARLPVPKEIIIIDDCSTDRTRETLAEFGTFPDVKVVLKPQNEGKGAAVRTGFAEARGSVVVVQDADLEYDPRDILPLLGPLVSGEADAVFGSRFLGDVPRDPSLVHRLGNGILTWASNTLTGLRLTDMETCYKAFRREALLGLSLKQNRFGFEPEITAKLARRKCRIREVPIGYQARGYAEGKKIGLKDAFNAFWCIARYAFAD